VFPFGNCGLVDPVDAPSFLVSGRVFDAVMRVPSLRYSPSFFTNGRGFFFLRCLLVDCSVILSVGFLTIVGGGVFSGASTAGVSFRPFCLVCPEPLSMISGNHLWSTISRGKRSCGLSVLGFRS